MRSGKQEASRKNWLPLNIERYDRNAALAPGETAALRRHAHEHHPAKATLHDKVRRLIEPVEDLFSHTKLRPAVRPSLVLYLLREMNRHCKSFWGWTTEEWIETINNQLAHQQHLAALAYLFCGFTELNALGSRPPLYMKLAEKVFGQNVCGSGARTCPDSPGRVGLFRDSYNASHTANALRGATGQS